MISSGMIPSGEKKQEDLGKTQYGTVPSPNALSDVYKKMYETKEEVINEHHKKDADGNTIPHEGEEINEEPISLTLGALKAATAVAGKKALAGGAKMLAGKAGLKAVAKPTISNVAKAGGEALKRTAGNPMVQSQAMMSAGQPKGKTNKTSTISAGADLFDIVKGQLLDEGLTEEEIRDIMLTLTPDEILNEMGDYPAGKGGNYRETPKPNKPEPKQGEPGSKLDAKGRQRFNPLNKDPYSGKTSKYDEEYKKFDPKKPDPKQVAAQAQQEKNKQKFNDPMGVKNTNIGGRGKDLG